VAWASQVGLLLFLVASGATGGRLLWRGLRQKGRTHELLLGITYFNGFNGGPLGYAPMILVMTGVTPDAWTTTLRAIGHANLEASAFALFLFNRMVFRPASDVIAAATWAMCAGLVAGWIALFTVGFFDGRSFTGNSSYWFDFWLRAAAYAWFLLWGVAMGAITAMFANAAITAWLSDGMPPPSWFLLDAAFALITSATMWVTFFPPRRYLAWLAPLATPAR
jgi:hypothetical protein